MTPAVLLKPEAQNLRAALRGKFTLAELDSFLEYDPRAIERLSTLTQRLHEKDKLNGRNRSLEQIARSVAKGFYCELAVYYMLFSACFSPEFNEIPEGTRYAPKFNFDLTCEGLKLEIKAMPIGNTFFSYSVDEENEADYLKVKNFRENWYDYDVLIAVKTDYTSNAINATFMPWIMIDSSVFEPAKKLFIFREANEEYTTASWFLKMDVCERNGQMRRI